LNTLERELSQEIEVQFVHVRAHATDAYNNKVDEMARSVLGVDKYGKRVRAGKDGACKYVNNDSEIPKQIPKKKTLRKR